MSATLIYFLAPMATGKTVAAQAMAARLKTDLKRVYLLDDPPLCMAKDRRRTAEEIEAMREMGGFVIVTSSHPCAAQFLPPPHFVFHPVDGRQAGRGHRRRRPAAKKGAK